MSTTGPDAARDSGTSAKDYRLRKRYVRTMGDLGFAADLSAESIERYRLTELARHRAPDAVETDVKGLLRDARLRLVADLPKVYRDSFARLGLTKARCGYVAVDLHSLMGRVDGKGPQTVLSLRNIEDEIASWPSTVVSSSHGRKRQSDIRLLRHDLVEVDFRRDIAAMVMPAHLEGSLASFLRRTVDCRSRNRWTPYLVFLASRSSAFEVSEALLEEFHIWMRGRQWPDVAIADALGTIHYTVRSASRTAALGRNGRYAYRRDEIDLTLPMRSFLNDVRDRANKGGSDAKRPIPCRVRKTLKAFCAVCRTSGLDPLVTEQTMEAFHESLRRRGASRLSIREAFEVLRQYCRDTGDGMNWLRADEGRRPHSSLAPVRMPPTVQRKFDLFEKHVLLGRFNMSLLRLRKIKLLLGRLFRFCRTTGRTEELSEEAIGAYFVWLSGRAQTKSVRESEVRLQGFLRQTDLHNAWLASGRLTSHRAIEQIVRQRHWDQVRAGVLATKRGRITLPTIRRLDSILAYASTHKIVAPAQILALAGSDRNKLYDMVRALHLVDPQSALLFPIRSAAGLTNRRSRGANVAADPVAIRYDVLLSRCP